ncbi:hypothetical protein TNCV_144561 [Trichonephila clavipes]|nr:hypothetical protein TNCV_144561 [Trichonephila clavipes]
MLLPISMFSSPSSSGRTVVWGQRNADHWPTCIEPSLRIRLHTVWLDILRPVAKSNCLCSCVAFSVLFRRAVNCMYRSSGDIVARARPAPGRHLTFLFLGIDSTALQQHFWRLQQPPRHYVVFARIPVCL